MVGFGSTLRMGRRSGWEGAYLDYETLKLLLSQIEAVYEEEDHRRPQNGGTADYRDELFLESDSDAAYASLEDDNDAPSNDEVESQSTQAKPFTLSYSHEASSSEEEVDVDTCGSVVPSSLTSWTTWDRGTKSTADAASSGKPNPRLASRMNAVDTIQEDEYYVKNPNVSTGFYMTGGDGSQQEPAAGPSILNAPVLFRTSQTEASSLLPPATPAHPNSNLYTFASAGDGITTPPSTYSFMEPMDRTPSTPPNMPSLQSKKFFEERQKDRQQRRKQRRKLRAQRRERERKVPRHLRVAHSKARAITERFLGLLRAETEKVTLFAQSRLGELADTAGSLRFASIDDADHIPSNDMRTAASYEYPLSDGGLHPSASSSEDDGTGFGAGVFPWSDSSDGEDSQGNDQRVPTVPKAFSVGALSDETAGRSNRTKSTPQKSTRKTTARSRENTDELEGSHVVRRQLAHFASIRRNRPVFQRNDHILGEDMLLISAVEEADGYTAIAVELMHVLRFICVNLIAVRKICRKHDRLLMNRMLGGYYQRTKTVGNDRYARIEDSTTLGGTLARVSGDIYEAHPALIGHMTYYKLIGVYDRKIQKLANSRTVQVVSSCLALALSEYEVARTRADALTHLNSTSSIGVKTPKRSGSSVAIIDEQILQPALSDDEGVGGPPSTASGVSLTRLRFSVSSIFALREAARTKLDHYASFLSRSIISFTGPQIVGEGLDGCSRETLDFVVSLNPDAILLYDTSILYEGMKRGNWKRIPVGDVMISVLATASCSPGLVPRVASMNASSPEELDVAHAVSVVPGPIHMLLKQMYKGHTPNRVEDLRSQPTVDIPSNILRLSRTSAFLYMMNYYVAHSITNTFVVALGADSAHSASIIGAPNAAAILVAVFHSVTLVREHTERRFPSRSVDVLRRIYLRSAVFGLLGNIVNGIAINAGSIPLAVLGRFLLGFSSTEIPQRQVLSACLPAYLVSESSRLVQFRVFGIICGLSLGFFVELIPATIKSLGIRVVQANNWLMALLWVIHMFRISLHFGTPGTSTGLEFNGLSRSSDILVEDFGGSASSSSDEEQTPTTMLYRSNSDMPTRAALKTYNSAGTDESTKLVPLEDHAFQSSHSMEAVGPRKSPLKLVRTYILRLKKLLAYHVGIPLSMFALLFSNYASELFFTSAPVLSCRYFGWSGAHAGIFLAWLAVLILPVNLVAEIIARRYEERALLKVRLSNGIESSWLYAYRCSQRSLFHVTCGLFLMINFSSLFSLAQSVPHLLAETNGPTAYPYDWRLGVVQYVVGLLVTFVSLTCIESSSLSLLSKVSPPRFRSLALNVSTLSVFLALTARIVADLQIFMVEISRRLINADIVNSLVIPSMIASLAVAFLVKKYFYFLM